MTTSVSPTTGLPALSPTRVARRSHIGPRLGAVALVLGAGANTAQAVLAQVVDRPDDVVDQITLANERTGLVGALVVVGLLAVPFMALGFVAAAQELARSSRRLGVLAGSLLVLGMWGFLGMQVAGLVQLSAMLDPAGAATATYLDGMQDSALLGVLFGLPFFLGTVLGMLVLTVGLLVRGDLPRWVPGAWLVFIVLDFSVGAVGPVDPHWLYLAGAVGLAGHLLRGRVGTGR